MTLKRRPAGGRREFLGAAASFGAWATARAIAPGAAGFLAPRLAAQPTGTRLILLGTQGGPNFHPERAETASALVVDETVYLVDCGYGTLAALREAGIVYRDIGRVFLTHLHDDHIGDLAAFVTHQWSDGRVDPTLVIGPYGTDSLVDAALAFGEANTAIRLVDEARNVRPADIFEGVVIEATAHPSEAYSDERVLVHSVENTHFPASSKAQFPYRSLAYRFDCPDRSIVFSGDTSYSEHLVELARGADVLVCEAIEVASMRRAFERMVANGAYADNAEGVWDHIVGTHTSTEDAGRMAAESGVATLVLNHLVPGALAPDVGDEVYAEGARRHFDGELVVGRDGMVL